MFYFCSIVVVFSYNVWYLL